ncbi:MAG: hypothetical protein A2355_16885 [Spirochaetes bacterium RIFOXYB1_FULL_32_8]|nr:MAG: hypothetical protein A2Y30_06510 [Spirochaetes bacterium GWE1_32_154]OHD52633.1 MAG: hypothetical protein A2Y29_09655 [Spirochaetes bacterium GWE2_31_10]OHD73246.1 MAG: hypothetical protein A2355_16885 [Spirochaetes bacterium RIFOXYB1_FULL_32_8]HBI36183.1 hypothetical protein [Spirochaetia bacterium]
MRKFMLIIYVLMTVNLFFGEVLLLKDGSIIKGKIIKMDEDNLVVLSAYGEMLIERSKIKKTYFADSEYEKELAEIEAEKNKQPEKTVVKETVVKEIVVERVINSTVHTEKIETILFMDLFGSITTEDVATVLNDAKINYVLNSKTGLINGYKNNKKFAKLSRLLNISKKTNSLYDKRELYYQFYVNEGTIRDAYFVINKAGNEIDIIKQNIESATGLTFKADTENAGVYTALTTNNIIVDIYKISKQGNVSNGLCIYIRDKDSEKRAFTIPTGILDFHIGIGYAHGAEAGYPYYLSHNYKFGTFNVGLSGVGKKGSFGLMYIIGPSLSLKYSLIPRLDISNQLLFSGKWGGMYGTNLFVFNFGLNFGYSGAPLFIGFNSDYNYNKDYDNSPYYYENSEKYAPGAFWYAGPSLYWGVEARTKKKKNFAYNIGVYIDWKFSSYVNKYPLYQYTGTDTYLYSSYDSSDMSKTTQSGSYTTFVAQCSWGIQMSWQGVARKVLYK